MHRTLNLALGKITIPENNMTDFRQLSILMSNEIIISRRNFGLMKKCRYLRIDYPDLSADVDGDGQERVRHRSLLSALVRCSLPSGFVTAGGYHPRYGHEIS